MVRAVLDRARDERDLMALDLLSQGATQPEVCGATGIPRGSLVRMLREIRADEAAESKTEGRA